MTLKSQFSNIYQYGKRWHCDGIVVFYKQSLENKVGFVASKKIGNAVQRVRAKRRMRAIFFKNQNILKDGIYLCVAKNKISETSYDELSRGFNWSLKRLKCLTF
ncbi:MAG: ribonuclease P protein component [Sulfurospirillum sp.]|nr:ribonuclease P protein component [Sulfurospirillum sp.]MBL0703489.1 ribonuclease P protein component [Sulfurospirillum sp.]